MHSKKIVNPKYIGKFNIVTNFGTSEHVKNQEQCFANIHNLCCAGGVMIHTVPMKNHWRGHGLYKYDISELLITAHLQQIKDNTSFKNLCISSL